MKNLQSFFENLSPTNKRRVAIGGTVLAVGTFIGIAMNAATPDERVRANKKPEIEAVLTDEDPRAVGLDSLNSQQKALISRMNRLERVLGQKEKDRSLENAEKQISDMQEQMTMLQQELGRIERQGGGHKENNADGKVDTREGEPQVVESPAPGFVSKATSSADKLGSVYANLPPPPPVDPKARTSEKSEGPKIRTIGKKDDDKDKDKQEEVTVTLPSGSILSGVLMTGMDAPTGKQAQRDPFPSLLRIKSEAILPNRFRADFRECFLIAAGWGDLSSERAYMRAERISCVRNDGAILESAVDAYATGEDGKAGIRGRLVSKQGQILARSLMAGFMQGVSSAFDVRQVPSINITRSSDADGAMPPVYEQAFDGNALQAAGVGGVGSALERIADFYLEMAENIFPVIEIDAMRDVDFIVKKGMTFKFTEATTADFIKE